MSAIFAGIPGAPSLPRSPVSPEIIFKKLMFHKYICIHIYLGMYVD